MRMTPEEKERYDRIDRQLEFLAAHQAQLSSDIAVLYQTSAKHDEQIARHGDQIAQMGVNVQSLADSVLRLARVVDERDRQTNERFAALNEKLGALIDVVERYFSNGKHE